MKRFLALLLCLALCLSLLPVGFAEDRDIIITEEQIPSEIVDLDTIPLSEKEDDDSSILLEAQEDYSEADEMQTRTILDPLGSNVSGSEFIAFARNYIGVPYVSGGRSPQGFDCCGFVWYVCNHFGIDIGNDNQVGQINYGTPISYNMSSYSSVIQNMEVGDLVYFHYSGWSQKVNHVAIYTGNGNIINSENGGVMEHSLNQGGWPDGYMWSSICGIRRVLSNNRPGKPVFNNLEGSHSASEPVYFWWDNTEWTTHYNIWVYKENDYGEYEAVDHSFYVESGYSLTLEPGYYKAVLQAYNSELWESDHSDWVYTESDPTYFTVESSKGYTLDINGLLDGETAGWIGNYGTVDVYINGELVADDVDDYYVWHPEGTYYFITDVKVFDGKTFNGYADGSASYYGYLYEDTEVILSYSSLYSLDLNGLLDGEWAYWIKDYGTVDIYVNGELVADDADDFFQYYPAGTYYYITDISANIGKEYNGFAYGSAEFYGYLYEDTEVILSYSTMQSYYVTIYPNGGYFRDSGSSAPIQVLRTVGEELDLLGNEYLMRRPGYLYMGLSISPTEIDYNGNDYFGLCYDPDEIVPYSLYGAWEKIDDRIITYDANGGTGAPAPQTKVYDEDITLSSVRPTRASSSAGSYTITLNANGGSVSPTSLSAARTTHYTFSTWNTARDGSGIKYDPETIYSGNDNLTLYAQWFSITLTSSVMLPTPSRDGYSFRGWASSSTASSGFFDSYMPDGNETLYATWVKTETPPDETLFLSDSDITLPVFSNVYLELRNGKGNIVTASWFSSDENVATVDENGLVTANKYGKCTIYAVAGGKGYACEVQTLFWDVADPSVYYFKHVYWAAENGITKGYNLEYFDPQGTCTREQMMTFLWRMAGKPEPKTTTSKFSDVEKGAYYYKAVLWGVEKGITNGYSTGEYAGKFGVGLPCTREQAMTFLWRLAGKPNPKTTTNKFADVKSSDYFYKAVLWASENKIANGYSSGEYAGKYGVGLACLREHMVTFLSRYYSKFMP